MIWLLGLAIIVLIAGALALWMKRGAANINDYFCDAVIVYAVAGEESARVAALAAAKVAASLQRASMVEYLRGMASDAEGQPGGDIICKKLLELADEITSKDWGWADIIAQKRLLGAAEPAYLCALENADLLVFRKKWPAIF